MIDLTYQSHFKFGYDNKWFVQRRSSAEKWTTSYGSCSRITEDFKQECLATAQLIRDSISGTLVVFFSGGSDSEVVIRSFYESKIPIRAAICQFKNNLNIHDVSFAVVCCEQLGIPYDLIQLDIEQFMNDRLYWYAGLTQARSPELCSTMWLADQIDGVPIFGSGECYLVKRVSPNYIDGQSEYETTPWDLYEKELIASWYRFFMNVDRIAVPGFFQYTPEIMLSFLKEDKIKELVNDKIKWKRSSVSSKMSIYQKHFPLIDRKKYTGYEKLEDKVEQTRLILRDIYPYSGSVFMTEYNDLVDILEGNINGPKGTTLI